MIERKYVRNDQSIWRISVSELYDAICGKTAPYVHLILMEGHMETSVSTIVSLDKLSWVRLYPDPDLEGGER